MTFAARFLFVGLFLASIGPASAQSKSVQTEIATQMLTIGGFQGAEFLPNGRHVILRGSKRFRLFDIQTNTLVREFETADKTISFRQVRLSPDAKQILSVEQNGLARVWDPSTDKHVHEIKTETDMLSDAVAYSPDGTRFLIGSGKTVRVWDIKSGAMVRELKGHTKDITAAKFSPNGRFIVSAGESLRVWDAASGNQIRQIKGTASELFFSPDSERIIFGGDENQAVVIVEIATGTTIRRLNGIPVFNTLAVSPDGQSIVSGDGYKGKVWNAATGTMKFELPGGDGPFNGAAFSSDGSLIIMEASGHLLIWAAATGTLVQKLKTQTTGVSAVAYSPDGSMVLTGHRGKGLRLWDATTGQLVREITRSRTAERDLAGVSIFDDRLTSVAFSSDGRFVVAASDGQTVQVWDASSGNLIRDLKGMPKYGDSVSVSISPDGQQIAAGGGDRFARLWDARSGQAQKTAASKDNTAVTAVGYFPDGRTFVTGHASGMMRIWNSSSGTMLREFKVHTGVVTSVTVASDGQRVLSGSYENNTVTNDNGVRLWNASSGALIGRLPTSAGTYVVRISPDGRHVATASGDQTIRLWDIATASFVRTISPHPGIKDFAFSADGRQIVSVGDDALQKRWSVATGELLATTMFFGESDWIVLTPEGFFAASTEGANLLRVVRGLDVFPISQFYQSLYRPDLVKEKLAGDPRGLVRAAAANLDLTRVLASGNAPEVSIVSPANGTALASRDTSAVVELIHRGGGIGRVEWRVNGVTVGVDTPPAPAANQPIRLTRSLSLDPGNNTIVVVAYNASNLVASLPVRATMTAPAAAPGQPVAAQPSRLFVIAAGIDDYTDSRLKLAGSLRDVRALSKAFTTTGTGLYQSVNVKLLTDADVNKTKLEAAFKEFAAQATPADVFVLHLAGHGKTVDGRYYFVPRDFKVGNNNDEKAVNAAVVAQGIAQEQWQRWFASIPARKSMILFDTCESGSLTGDAAQTKALEQSAANDRLAQATGRSIITAASSTQLAFEYRGHGLFTYNLLDAMERADSDGNGTIEINELAAYVYAQVTRLSEQVFKTRQEPQIRIASSYPLTRQGRVLAGDLPVVAEDNAPSFQLAQTANLQIKPGPGATVVRSLNAKTAVTVLKNEGGWSLVASGGKPLGYVATRDLAPAAKAATR